MTKKEQDIERLKTLYAEIAKINEKHGISAKGEEIFAGDLAEERIIVVSDGLGGADLMIVEGNYPVDYYTKHETSFKADEACRHAARLLANSNNNDIDPADEGKEWDDLIKEGFGFDLP